MVVILNNKLNGYCYNPNRSVISNDVSDQSLKAYVKADLYLNDVQKITISVFYNYNNHIDFTF